MSIFRGASFALLALSSCVAGRDRPSQVPTGPSLVAVRIHSHWLGYGRSTDVDMTLSADGSVQGFDGGGNGDHPLLGSVAKRPDRFAPQALRNLAVEAAKRCTPQLTPATVGLAPASLDRLKAPNRGDAVAVQRALEEALTSEHTDDYPDVEVFLSLTDGTQTILTSTSQHSQLLPWHVKSPTQNCLTFNPVLSSRIAAVMAPTDDQRMRVAEPSIADEVAHQLAFDATRRR